MQTASITPERQLLARPFDWLLIAFERRRVKMQGTWLPLVLVMLIGRRIIDARQRFYRLVERIRAGKFCLRKPASTRPAAPGQPSEKPPRKPPCAPANPMFAKFGWMNRLMPGAESGHCHHALLNLFEDPTLAPLLAAAPAAVWRELRPLCWMLGVRRPALLAPPPRPAKLKACRPKIRKRRTAKAPKTPKSAVQGLWTRMPSAHWPPGVLDPPRKA
jgi:hypothetical protein